MVLPRSPKGYRPMDDSTFMAPGARVRYCSIFLSRSGIDPLNDLGLWEGEILKLEPISTSDLYPAQHYIVTVKWDNGEIRTIHSSNLKLINEVKRS